MSRTGTRPYLSSVIVRTCELAKVEQSSLIHIIALTCAIALVCISCSTSALLKTSERSTGQGNHGEAYTNILQQIKRHPNNKELLDAKSRVGELFAQDLVKGEESVPTNHLVQRIQL